MLHQTAASSPTTEDGDLLPPLNALPFFPAFWDGVKCPFDDFLFSLKERDVVAVVVCLRPLPRSLGDRRMFKADGWTRRATTLWLKKNPSVIAHRQDRTLFMCLSRTRRRKSLSLSSRLETKENQCDTDVCDGHRGVDKLAPCFVTQCGPAGPGALRH